MGWGRGLRTRAGRALPGCLGYQVKGDGQPPPLKGQAALPTGHPDPHVFSSLLAGWLSLAPMSISIFLRCAGSRPVRPHGGLFAVQLQLGWARAELLRAGEETRSRGVWVLVLLPPWRVPRTASPSTRGRGPGHTAPPVQVPQLLPPFTCQAWRSRQSPDVTGPGAGTALSLQVSYAQPNPSRIVSPHTKLSPSPQRELLSVSRQTPHPAHSSVSAERARTSGANKTRTEFWLCHLLALVRAHG